MSQPSALTYEGVLGLIEKVTAQIERLSLDTTTQMQTLTAETDRKIQATTTQIEKTTEQMKENAEQMKENAEQMKMQTAETDRKIQATTKQIEKTTEQINKTAEQIERTNKNVGGLSSNVGEIIKNMVAGNIDEKFQAVGYHEIDKVYEKVKFKNKKLDIDGEIDLFLENGGFVILIEVKTTLEAKDVTDHVERIEKYRRYIDAKGGDKRRFIGAVAGGGIVGDAIKVARKNGLYVIVQSGEAVEILPTPDGFVATEW